MASLVRRGSHTLALLLLALNSLAAERASAGRVSAPCWVQSRVRGIYCACLHNLDRGVLAARRRQSSASAARWSEFDWLTCRCHAALGPMMLWNSGGTRAVSDRGGYDMGSCGDPSIVASFW